MTRKDFMKGSAAGLLAAAGGCLSDRRQPEPAGMAWGVLMHLGGNMWKDWVPEGRYPSSLAEERQMYPSPKLSKYGYMQSMTRDYVRTDRSVWRQETEFAAAEGLNEVIVDIAEAYAYPSHPELWVKGSLSFDELRRELDDLRTLGLEPVPKLNFSTAHDAWLKEYHFMTSSSRYHEVVSDLIRDVCEVFDGPRYFHLGFDEETVAAVEGRQLMVLRQGDLWWRDFFRTVNEVERHGVRAMVWSDKICSGRDEFLRRMPRSVLQVPWYYWSDFSLEKLKWRKELEVRKDWTVQDNLAASLSVLAEAGYDLMPCVSNYCEPAATESLIGYCRTAIDPNRIKGFFASPWTLSTPQDDAHIREGIRLLADARRKHYHEG